MTSDGWQVGGVECGIQGGRKRESSGGSEKGEEDWEHRRVRGGCLELEKRESRERASNLHWKWGRSEMTGVPHLSICPHVH